MCIYQLHVATKKNKNYSPLTVGLVEHISVDIIVCIVQNHVALVRLLTNSQTSCST